MTIMKSISSMGNVASASSMTKSTVSASSITGLGQGGNENAGLLGCGLTRTVGGTVIAVENVVNGVLFTVLGLVDGLLGGVCL
ncbi:hypothetical protein SAMD00019534_073430, partial [Acytostelium subglobosum LB1]|uniref:hypothetical protein n=1 Tax=Acytostelium subglobosum LB1 TaxID=1410327 RepID=UPI0006449927